MSRRGPMVGFKDPEGVSEAKTRLAEEMRKQGLDPGKTSDLEKVDTKHLPLYQLAALRRLLREAGVS